MDNQIVELPTGGVRNCESCNSHAVRMSFENQTFSFGVGDQAVELSVRVPVWTCEACGDQYTDSVAEEIRHAAVCKHLGRLAPAEIVRLRKIYDLTQSEFAILTGIGVASIKRWEAGNQIQNESFDKFLRLLYDKKNIEMLRRPKNNIAMTLSNGGRSKFMSRFSAEVVKHASAFKLRRKSQEPVPA
jgi:putative zinc finger/helix-turn-helix YgiT family protein